LGAASAAQPRLRRALHAGTPAIKHQATYRIDRALALAEPDALIEADGREPKELLRSTQLQLGIDHGWLVAALRTIRWMVDELVRALPPATS
jgi:hypothetical protein